MPSLLKAGARIAWAPAFLLNKFTRAASVRAVC